MTKVRKKPVIVDALQWTGENSAEIDEFIGDSAGYRLIDGELSIHTLEGAHKANQGDWIIKGVKGEFYPCKPDIFDETYEVVE